MTSTTRLLLFGPAVVLFYDAAASGLCRLSGIPYKNFTAGSLVIYFTIGVIASRWQVNSVIAGAVAGFTEATLGWLISAVIGPGRATRPLTISLAIIVIFSVTLSAVLLAAFGYFAESRMLYRLWQGKS